MKGTLSLKDAQMRVSKMENPRITEERIKGRIKGVRYLVDGPLTICVIEMCNGFKQTGEAAPADPRNYDREVGERYAYEDAFRGLWKLEGYLLCESLMNGGGTAG